MVVKNNIVTAQYTAILNNHKFSQFHKFGTIFSPDVANEWVLSNQILVFVSGIATGQTLQLTRKKCMAKGYFDVQNMILVRLSLFSPLF